MECEERPLSFKNDRGETLTGIMCSKGKDEKECAIICHSIATDKNWNFLPTVAKELPMDTYRFDFSGHGDSEGEFDFCCYERHVADLRAVITSLRNSGKNVSLLAGYGTGANVVLLYASQHDDVPAIINIGARYRMEKSQYALFTADEKLTCQRQGWVMWLRDNREFKVTEDAVKRRTKVDMAPIKKITNAKVLTLHGSADKEVHVEDARIIDSVIPQSTLFIIPDGDHAYSREEYIDAMMRAIMAFLAPTEAAGCCAIL